MLLNSLKMGLGSMKLYKLRTLLCVACLSIGVLVLASVLAISQGITNKANDALGSYDKNTFIVSPSLYPGYAVSQRDIIKNPLSLDSIVNSSLSTRDLDTLASNSNIDTSAAYVSLLGSARIPTNATSVRLSILGVTPSFMELTGHEMAKGQWLGSVDNPDAVVLGSGAAESLLGSNEVIGQTVLLNGHRFTVVGVMKDDKIDSMNVLSGFDMSAIIPIDSAASVVDYKPQISGLIFKTRKGTNSSKVQDVVSRDISKNHKGSDDVSVQSVKDINDLSFATLETNKLILLTFAGLLLLIGGIGLMNVMFVGVSARAREISIRKTVGATNGQIFGQFMAEATLIGVLSGVVGLTLSGVVAYFVERYIGLQSVYTQETVMLVLILSVAIGLVFGFVPAFRAARKSSIQVLHQD